MTHWYQKLVWKTFISIKKRGYIKQYNIETVFHDKPPKPPFVLVANHAHKSDPFLVGTMSGAECIHYMANIDGVSSFRKKLAHITGAYSKKKGLPDIKALKATFDYIRDGSAIGIFVEGDRTWDGETAKVLPGTAGLIRKLKVPVWVVHLQGSYLSWPRWAENQGLGKIKMDFHVISAEETRSMTADELHKKLEEMLYQNDIKDKENLKTGFSGTKRAEGIHRALWICPECNSHDSIIATEDKEEFLCSSCNKSWQLDGNLRITPHTTSGFIDIKDWIDWEKKTAEKILLGSADKKKILTKTSSIELQKKEGSKIESLGKGDLKLYHDRIEFVQSDSSEILTFSPLKDILGFIDNFNNYCEFTYHNERFRILFKDQNALKWIHFLDSLK